MAKRSSSSIANLSIAELNREISRRRRSLPALQRRREKAMAKVAKIDAMIAALGGSSGGGGAGRRGRGSNDATLADYLRRALTGNTMGVTEVAEAVQKIGYKTNSPNFRTIVNAALMSKKNGFKRVARGKYTAA
ncbi:MAG TPA: hypothetical protein VEB22_04575 [Phycisphaerales bacterium]|nr:hypothetical protein [Phycisphaerales bacterium]